MGTLIDSSILIAVERGKLNFDALLRRYADVPLVLAAITASELLHGVHRAVDDTRRASREQYVNRMLQDFPVLPFDLTIARVHARLDVETRKKGTPIGANDLQIAATAVAIGYSVATRDLRSFPHVPGLAVETL